MERDWFHEFSVWYLLAADFEIVNNYLKHVFSEQRLTVFTSLFFLWKIFWTGYWANHSWFLARKWEVFFMENCNNRVHSHYGQARKQEKLFHSKYLTILHTSYNAIEYSCIASCRLQPLETKLGIQKLPFKLSKICMQYTPNILFCTPDPWPCRQGFFQWSRLEKNIFGIGFGRSVKCYL